MRSRLLEPQALVAALLAATALACGNPPIPQYLVAARGADRDGDGAADVDDACPDEPEDGLPPKANDGCPADDPDRDGIGRATDLCPDAKEDGEPPNPTDGCPGVDTDGDGVADSRDACPDAQEDNLGEHPSDGCPAPDRDGDGVADVIDRCPDAPETHNGYQDEDGCPDDAPGGQVVYNPKTNTIYIPNDKRIQFAKGSAVLDGAGLATVGEIVALLKAHPEISRVEIEGHASSVGSDAVNLNITERRAIAVAQALKSRGVDPQRLVPIGYGEFCPAIDKGDNQDVPENRRVLFKAVVVNGVWQDVPRGCWRAQTHGIDPTKRKPGVPTPPPVVKEEAGGVL